MAKMKIPDGINVKQAQYKKLLTLWNDVKDQLDVTAESLEHYKMKLINDSKVELELFGFHFNVFFIHNFKLGQLVYSRTTDDGRQEILVTINYDEKGKLGDPYGAYSVKEFASVNLHILDSITSVSRLAR